MLRKSFALSLHAASRIYFAVLCSFLIIFARPRDPERMRALGVWSRLPLNVGCKESKHQPTASCESCDMHITASPRKQCQTFFSCTTMSVLPPPSWKCTMPGMVAVSSLRSTTPRDGACGGCIYAPEQYLPIKRTLEFSLVKR